MELSKWMANIDDGREVFSLNLPGTHDCAAQYVQLSFFSKCQRVNIYEQLCLGARSLDIRVKPENGRLKMVHGRAAAYNKPFRRGVMYIDDVLKMCYRFLDENPSECIIFQFKNDDCLEQELSFDLLFDGCISKNPERWYIENKMPLLGEARGKIILLRRCKMNDKNEYTNDNTGIDFSRWVEQEEAVPKPLKLETNSKDGAVFVIQDRYSYKPKPRWEECILPFLKNREPFCGEYIIEYISTAGGIRGPRGNAAYINPRFAAYPLDNNLYYGTIYIDFLNREISEKIIKTNMESLWQKI